MSCSLHLQEWRYKNAVALDADGAAQHGLQAGALVLASTLSGMPVSIDNVLAEQQPNPVQELTVSWHTAWGFCAHILNFDMSLLAAWDPATLCSCQGAAADCIMCM